MFTPPPSPLPPTPPPSSSQVSSPSRDVSVKNAVGRRTTRWALLIVPIILIGITASTRFLTHPHAFDLLLAGSGESMSWKTLITTGTDFRPHKRHWGVDPRDSDDGGSGAGDPVNISSGVVATVLPTPSLTASMAALDGTGSSTGNASASMSATTTTPPSQQPVPTVPSSPPLLPTPFPQPFEQLSADNLSIACATFLANMTNSPSFRRCRPFSLLLQNSNTFVQAQTNLSLINNITWGICNAPIPKSQCVQNMNSYASQLQDSCSKELDNHVAVVSDALVGLNAFAVMYDAACLIDPSSTTYCYVNGVHAPTPQDIYLYNLPLGLRFPTKATPSCTACSKDILNIYAMALEHPPQADTVHALSTTYDSAAKPAMANCGNNFAVVINASGAASITVLPSLSTFPLFITLTWIILLLL
ncbi:hypothetical protein AMATHDRAFT_75921 [Amanita thiersii Skay4041]|uniref:DUF7729 domain-containing protein n=1 Tax=Amanita thiersii Skay4041 TaxID=703135 RepID=A0A2A9NFX4_9AGAR|nr:hypothetical protein AMATHDRAFT_75921 [Amanita thiersii Skay4041]